MKIKPILTLILLAFSFPMAAQYIWSNPQPSGYINNTIVFTSSNTGFIANANGDLLKTSDSGENWSIYKNFFRARTVAGKDSIMAVGGDDSCVYISLDTGKTWKKNLLRHDWSIVKIQIINKDTLFAFDKNFNIGTSEIHQSTDGGSTWHRLNNSLIIKAIDFVNSKLGFASSFGGVFKTTDGGVTWNHIYETAAGGNSYNTLKFQDQYNGIVALINSQIIKTHDGGITWDTVYSTHQHCLSIQYVTPSMIILAGEQGSIEVSTDSGYTWRIKSGKFEQINSSWFTSQSTGFFTGFRGAIGKTVDSANNIKMYSPTYHDITPIFFPTASDGYAVAFDNIMKTADGGKSWNLLPHPTLLQNAHFDFLHFYSRDTGIAFAGTFGQFYRTQNGGTSWQMDTLHVPQHSISDIEGFFVINNTIYLAVDDIAGHKVLRSRDRGESWQVQSQPATELRNLHFIDEQTGYGTLANYLYKTTDSARTWTQVPIITPHGLNGIWFTSPSTGFVVSGPGPNFQTADSGKSWQQFNIIPDNPNFGQIYSFRFFNKKVGYFTNGGGGIFLGVYKTIDGGRTWREDMATPGECRNMFMGTDTMLYVTGERGMIRKKDMREYIIDSLSAKLDLSCGARITASISAVLSRIDSIWLEYGAGGKRRLVESLPVSVSDSTIKSDWPLTQLSSDSVYMARIKIFYRNNYYYSDSITFNPNALPKPVITLNGTTLSSSASTGNQWFLNGSPIPGAVNSTYQPVNGGTYTVQQTVNGCTSTVSQGFNFTATAINDPVLAESILILPNPVRSTLVIKNRDAKKLRISIFDISGRIIKVIQTSKSVESINLESVSTGIYTLYIEDILSLRKTASRLVKW
jgi:photosystem II stability/assembly factor-like uncharacterized protein